MPGTPFATSIGSTVVCSTGSVENSAWAVGPSTSGRCSGTAARTAPPDEVRDDRPRERLIAGGLEDGCERVRQCTVAAVTRGHLERGLLRLARDQPHDVRVGRGGERCGLFAQLMGVFTDPTEPEDLVAEIHRLLPHVCCAREVAGVAAVEDRRHVRRRATRHERVCDPLLEQRHLLGEEPAERAGLARVDVEGDEEVVVGREPESFPFVRVGPRDTAAVPRVEHDDGVAGRVSATSRSSAATMPSRDAASPFSFDASNPRRSRTSAIRSTSPSHPVSPYV
jgi:hypothetical protein